MGLHTDFAPPAKNSAEEIKKQVEYFIEDGIFSSLLNAVPTFLLVVNESRQIVYANDAAKKLFPGDHLEGLYGKRTGELLNCSVFAESESGCGTTRFCSNCGAIKSMLASLSGIENNEECRIIQMPDGNALDFRVWSKPIKINDENYSIFALTDISDEKRRKALERIFFHDVINSADSILKLSEMLNEASGEEISKYNEAISFLTNRLIDEIKSQRDLLSAENNELKVNPAKCNSLNVISEAIVLYSNHGLSAEKEIITDKSSEDINFVSDKVLLKRVLGNMIKNALEATSAGGRVTAGSRKRNNEIEFFIHNNGYIAEEIQMQIFQRSFSTKGTGRGLGTYSMKLLSERYLQGSIGFETSQENGTTFYARFPLHTI
jgi:hypothetical protein